MSKQTRFLSAALLEQIAEPQAPNRPTCDEHAKTLYTSRHDARDAQVGAMKSRRIRIYPCDYHPDHYHVTKEDIRHQLSSWN
jgi:hypothetical protein